ncbi:hypothetical protein DFH07DRAFT_961789 [Mycena maculata]|uniref:Uncharacterized protein n=1 Tax=Mycena maculata TaxID=230809 RepID=A0AAD7N8P7_9AGAR|nr:hypothetical protein DFH07DRAFT_961789 [Mycena maculata]
MHASPLLSELVVIRSGSRTRRRCRHPEATTGYWKFTKHGVMRALRMGGGGGVCDGLVKEMDPEAVNRGDGRMPAADDTNYEKGLAQA